MLQLAHKIHSRIEKFVSKTERYNINSKATVLTIIACTMLTSAMLVVGCGKKAMPTPQDSREEFQWKSAVASYHAGCLNISAQLSGNVSNIDGILLQVQSMSSGDSCQGCPFLPQEEQTYGYNDVVLPGTGNNIAMNFCPATKAEAYQWRLIGRNVIRTFPYMTTNVQLVVPQENQGDIDFMPLILQN